MQGRKYAEAAERQLARGRFIQHTAQRENIRAFIQQLAPRLLRRHVGNRAQNRALGGEIVHRRSFFIDLFGQRTNHFGQTEVEHLRLAAGR